MSFEFWVLICGAALLLVAAAGAAVFLGVRLFRARRLLQQAGVPESSKVVFWGALIYLISPLDLIPDPVYLDDIGVLLLALRSLHKTSRRPVPTKGSVPPS
ncbi:YkvA family protein [Streptomyces aureoversilis]|uniref:YkvA family protein n=1 Tax=Streptomyces aureoversilis TaxID=67277 RepID=A0ABV9ZTT2_9ACTN